MAFTLGRRCSLCGGRLDGQLRCTECGLDNTKNDKMYEKMLNKSKCDGKALTHVHEENVKQEYSTAKVHQTSKARQNTNQKNRKNQKNQKNFGKIIATVIVILGILPSIFTGIFSLIESEFMDEIYYEEEYAYTDLEEYTYETILEPGFYTVGVHIPEATYDIEMTLGEFGNLEIFEYDGDELMSVDYYSLDTEYDTGVYWLDLFAGQILKVSSEIEVFASAYNETDGLAWEYNPLTAGYQITDTVVAGQDFPAGVYDIYYTSTSGEEFGAVVANLWSADVETFTLEEYAFFDGYMGDSYYRNVPLTAGSEVSVTGLENVMLIPSEMVDPNTQYLFE